MDGKNDGRAKEETGYNLDWLATIWRPKGMDERVQKPAKQRARECPGREWSTREFERGGGCFSRERESLRYKHLIIRCAGQHRGQQVDKDRAEHRSREIETLA